MPMVPFHSSHQSVHPTRCEATPPHQIKPSNRTVALRPSKPSNLANPACIVSQCQSHNKHVASLHRPKKSRLSSYPRTRGANQLRGRSSGGCVHPVNQGTPTPRVPTHSRWGASNHMQGPLCRSGGKETHQAHGPPTVIDGSLTLEFRRFGTNSGWMTDLSPRNPTEQPKRELHQQHQQTR